MYNIEGEYSRYVQQISGRIVSSETPGHEIRDLRTSLGITQHEIGRLIRLRRETVSRIENGAINPTFDFVKRFSRALAAAKIVRDLYAIGEMSSVSGQGLGSSLQPGFLKLYFKIPLNDTRLILDIGLKGYQKRKSKILKDI